MATEIRLENAEEVKNEYISVLNDNLWDLKQLDERLTSFKRFLVETGSSDVRFDYESQMGIISQIEEDFETYKIASKQMIDEIDHIDSEFNKELSACVERLSLINIDKYEVKNSAKIEYMYESRIAKNNYQVEIRKLTSVPDMLSFNVLMKTPLTRAMKKSEYDTFMTAILGNTIDSEDYYIQYINQLYKSAEFDHTTKAESIENAVTNVLSVIAIGTTLVVISGGIFGFAVPGYVATVGQVAGGILTAKDIGHLITGKDINGNPLSKADRQAITSSLIVEASMLAVNSLSKLKLKYANQIDGSTVKKLKYKTTSGLQLEATPGKTTTVLGKYDKDTKYILEELGNIKSTDFGPRDGGFNLLNTPDDLFKTPEQFWIEYNRRWLDEAIARGDIIKMATEPISENLYTFNKDTGLREITGFGREYEYLLEHGYEYDSLTKSMIKKGW